MEYAWVSARIMVVVRSLAAALVVLVACGDQLPGSARDARPPGSEPPAPADAAVLPPCPDPVGGTNLTARNLNPDALDLRATLTLATSPPNDLRLFVLRLDGTIWIFKDEVLQPTPFIDLADERGGPVTAGAEMGLLGLAFHPQYATNRQFFLFYTAGVPRESLRDVLARCQTSASDPDVADATSCVEILSFADPGTNHNAGMIEFGRDGYLYISTGDGGGGDAYWRSQPPELLFGKMLRIDVDRRDAGRQYGIPPDNPYANGGGDPAVFMRGMRNPWRWSFDRATGDMWIGDVGTSAFEELNFLRPEQQNGANLGYGVYEGVTCLRPPCIPDTIFPVDIRTHTGDGWSAIMGGQVYRGTCFPDLVGAYFYVDVALGRIVEARMQPDGTLVKRDTDAVVPRPTSIHEDARGELYVTSILGNVWRLEVAP
jgi:glucose/arabinose dehydrogenase